MPMTIAQVRNLADRPQEWSAFQGPDGAWSLKFKEPGSTIWVNICTRAGDHKLYRSAEAMLNDIRKIGRDQVIHTHFTEVIL